MLMILMIQQDDTVIKRLSEHRENPILATIHSTILSWCS